MAKAKPRRCTHKYGSWVRVTKTITGLPIKTRSCSKCGDEQRKLSGGPVILGPAEIYVRPPQ